MSEIHRPLISVVTPSYNQGDYIERNLLSVMEQEYPYVEHIVIDGGSSDGTVEILERYEEKYPLRWISEPDHGQSHAVNKGIHMANGDWIGWQNSDDFYLPGAFTKFANALKENPESDVVYGDLIIVDDRGKEVDRAHFTRPSKFIQRHWSNFTANHCTFFKSEVFDEIGGLNENLVYTMDTELFRKILQDDFELSHFPSFVACHRVHENAKTAGESLQKLDKEAQNIRNLTRIEAAVPEMFYSIGAISLKTIYFISECRFDAIDYAIRKRLKKYHLV